MVRKGREEAKDLDRIMDSSQGIAREILESAYSMDGYRRGQKDGDSLQRE